MRIFGKVFGKKERLEIPVTPPARVDSPPEPEPEDNYAPFEGPRIFLELEAQIDSRDLTEAETRLLGLKSEPKGSSRRLQIAGLFGRLYSAQGRFPESESAYREAIDGYRKAEDFQSLGVDLNNYGGMLRNVGRFDEALDAFRESIRSHEKAVLEPPQGVTREMMEEKNWTEDEIEQTLRIQDDMRVQFLHEAEAGAAMACLGIGNVMTDQGSVGAVSAYFEAVERYRNLALRNPEDYEYWVAKSLISYANSLDHANRYAEAQAAFEEGTGIYGQILPIQPGAIGQELGRAYHDYAVHLVHAEELDRAQSICEKGVEVLDQVYRVDPGLAIMDLSASYGLLGSILTENGMPHLSIESFGMAVTMLQQLVDRGYDDAKPRLIASLQGVARAFTLSGRNEEAEAMLVRVLTLTGEDPTTPETNASDEMAKQVCDTAHDLFSKGQREAAFELLADTGFDFMARAETDPDKYNPMVAAILVAVGQLMCEGEAPDAGQQGVIRAIRLLENQREKEPSRIEPKLAEGYRVLARIYWQCDWLSGSSEMARNSIRLYESLFKSERSLYRTELASIYRFYGVLCRNQEQLEQSSRSLDSARQLYQEEFERTASSDVQEELADTMNEQGVSCAMLGNHAEAKNYFHQAKNHYDRLVEVDELSDPKGIIRTYQNLGNFYFTQQDLDRSLEYALQADTIISKQEARYPGSMRTERAKIMGFMGLLYGKMGDHERAAACFLQAADNHHELYLDAPNEYAASLAEDMYRAGLELFQCGQYDEAIAALEKSVEIRRSLVSPDEHANEMALGMALNEIGKILTEYRGRHEEALSSQVESLAIFRRLVTISPKEVEPHLSDTLQWLGMSLTGLQKLDEAEPVIREAVEIRERICKFGNPQYELGLAASYHNLAAVMELKGKHSESAAFQKLADNLRANWT